MAPADKYYDTVICKDWTEILLSALCNTKQSISKKYHNTFS